MDVRCAALILSTLVLSFAPCRAQSPQPQPGVIAGWVERITLPDQGLVFEAKLDTGADSSSLNGHMIERFRRGGRSMVRFTLADDAGRSVQIETTIVRAVKVKRSGLDGDSRAVVRLKVCVGGQLSEGDFTVADRADLTYQVLIGRNVLAGRILVDSGRQRIVSDKCGISQ